MVINVKINTLNFDNKLKDCSSRRATEDHVTIRKTRGYKAKLGLGFLNNKLINTMGFFCKALIRECGMRFFLVNLTKIPPLF